MKKILSLLTIAAFGAAAWATEPVTIDLTQGESLTYTTDANWNTTATLVQDGITMTFSEGAGENKAKQGQLQRRRLLPRLQGQQDDRGRRGEHRQD